MRMQMCARILEGLFPSSDWFCWEWTATQRPPANNGLQVLTCYSCVNRAILPPKSQLIKHRMKNQLILFKFVNDPGKPCNDSVRMDSPPKSPLCRPQLPAGRGVLVGIGGTTGLPWLAGWKQFSLFLCKAESKMWNAEVSLKIQDAVLRV